MGYDEEIFERGVLIDSAGERVAVDCSLSTWHETHVVRTLKGGRKTIRGMSDSEGSVFSATPEAAKQFMEVVQASNCAYLEAGRWALRTMHPDCSPCARE